MMDTSLPRSWVLAVSNLPKTGRSHTVKRNIMLNVESKTNRNYQPTEGIFVSSEIQLHRRMSNFPSHACLAAMSERIEYTHSAQGRETGDREDAFCV